MRGTVIFWKRDFNNPRRQLFGWGFIEPDGLDGNEKDEPVYFNQKSCHYSPVMQGDVVELKLSKVQMEDRRAKTAHAVNLINREEKVDEPQAQSA